MSNAAAHHQVADIELFNVEEFRKALAGSNQPIPVLKQALKDVRARMDERFREGEDIRKLIYGRAWVMDMVLEAIWQRFDWPEKQTYRADCRRWLWPWRTTSLL